MTIVIGGGLAGLVTAHQLATAGHRITLIEKRSTLGGLIASDTIGGVRVDIGAESFARRNSAVTDFVHSLGLETLVPSGRSWIWNGGPLLIPKDTSLGIPADPHSPEIRKILENPDRVAADLTLDPSIGAEATTVAELVEARMGSEILERLVHPIATAIYSTDPSRLAINPQLKADFESTGSLAKAVARGLRGPAVAAVKGGMFHLIDTLVRDLKESGARILTNTEATGLSYSSGAKITAVTAGEEQILTADHVVLATSITPAIALLNTVTDLAPFTIPTGKPTTHVTLVLNSAELDGAPRGSGMLCVPGTSRAKALTHLSCKWSWMREVTDKHAVRVSYATDAQVNVDDALADMNELMGTSIGPESVAGSKTVRWGNALTPSTPELRQWADAITTPDWLHVTGAWRAGTGVASVIPHALQTAADVT